MKRKVENISKEEANLQWMAALLSGDYKQVQATLRKGENGFCCLGVACDVWTQLGGDGKWEDEQQTKWCSGLGSKEFIVNGVTHHGYMPHLVKEWLGLDDNDESDFIEMNDAEKAEFRKIAIEVEHKAFKR